MTVRQPCAHEGEDMNAGGRDVGATALRSSQPAAKASRFGGSALPGRYGPFAELDLASENVADLR